MPKKSLAIIWIAASGLAHAQLAEPFESDFMGRQTITWSDKALTADVTATTKVRTPWGVIESTEQGKYWRNGKGMIRQDDQHGLSLLLDLREHHRTLIDSRLKVINRDAWPPRQGNTTQFEPSFDYARAREKTGVSPGVIHQALHPGDVVEELEVLFENTGYFLTPGTREQTSVDGMEVTVYKLPHEEGTVEWWVSRDLKFVVRSRYVTEAAEFEVHYHNIRLENPPESLFQLPVEYPIRIVNKGRSDLENLRDPCSLGYHVTDGLTGQRSKKDGFARFNLVNLRCFPAKALNVLIPSRTLAALEPPQPAIAVKTGVEARLGDGTVPGGIRVDASVTLHGERVEGLRPEDFVLTEDRRRQAITAMARENLPLDIVFVLPRDIPNALSGQEVKALWGQFLQATAARALLQGSHPEDRVALVSYGLEPRLELPLTTNRTTIERAVLRARQAFQDAGPEINYWGGGGLGNLTAPAWETAIAVKSLAIDYATHVLSEVVEKDPASRVNRRRLIFIVTDLLKSAAGNVGGEYAGSPDEPVIQRLWDAGIVLSSIGMGGRAPFRDGTRRTPVDAYYRRNNPMHIANATGGDAMVAEESEELNYTLTRARERYVLWFDQPSGLPAGQERPIKVDLSPEARKRFPDAVVKARQGYVTR